MTEVPPQPTRVIKLPRPYLVFVGDTVEPGFAKTAFGLRDWAGDQCVGEFATEAGAVATGLERMAPVQAVQRGARSLVIGVANRGGLVPAAWVPALVEAMEAGLDIVSGLHCRLADIPAIAEAAARCGRSLIEVRSPPAGIPVATGRRRTGHRLLTVGTDCVLGKKYTALTIAREIAARGVPVDFRATGQTGIMISGGGLPIDAVVADLVAGAAELLSPGAAPEHWDVIEGQGSLFHPSYAGVSLGLLPGSQPDVIVVCHAPGRRTMLGSPGFALPSLEDAISLNLRMGSRVNAAIRCAGVALNTSSLSPSGAETAMADEEARLGLPVADPVRGGERLVQLMDACLITK